MKLLKSLFLSLAIIMACYSNNAYSMGRAAKIFESCSEKPSDAAIWMHGDSFFLRLDLAEIGGFKNETFIWGGFYFEASGVFKGELVINDFAEDEVRFPARAHVEKVTTDHQYFRIEVLNEAGEIIEHFLLEAPNNQVLM